MHIDINLKLNKLKGLYCQGKQLKHCLFHLISPERSALKEKGFEELTPFQKGFVGSHYSSWQV